jgi:GDP-L-fucose synthase
LAKIVKEVTQFEGQLIWDSSKPDGTFRKLMDSSKLNELGWKPAISIKEGIEGVYKAYQAGK